MKRVQIDQFEKIQTQSRVLYEEIGALSKKAPNDAVNKFKLKFINQTLQVANMLLGDEYKRLGSSNSLMMKRIYQQTAMCP